MRREYYRWYSDRVGRQMSVVVLGHWGPPMIMFPTSGGDEGEYERQSLIGTIAGPIEAGRVKTFFGQTIKEVTSNEVALMSARERDPKTAKETARIKNDYVFALIGGEKPTKFLESIGIKIG